MVSEVFLFNETASSTTPFQNSDPDDVFRVMSV